jgi:mono/diheme cytochrome c family protein
MRRPLKILLVLLALPIVAVLGLVTYAQATYERDFSAVKEPEIKASSDPAVVARGEYVVNAIAHCSACHGPGEFVQKHELGPVGDLRGGYVMHAGPFGTYYPANLTPDPETGIGRLTDGQLARAIRHGVDRNGRLAPLMSFAVGVMSDEDLTATVSYLRSVAPVRNETKRDEWGILAKVLAGVFEPHDEPVPKHVPAGGVSVERGAYIANGPGLCYGCHTPIDPMAGMKEAGPRFSGAGEAEPDALDPTFEVIAPNLTPDPETGHITSWTEDAFVARFRKGPIFRGTKMPWDNFARMTEDDLRSVYRYLRTLAPVKHPVGPTRREVGKAG